MALTGDLFFVGDVGRADLAGVDATRGLAADLQESCSAKCSGTTRAADPPRGKRRGISPCRSQPDAVGYENIAGFLADGVAGRRRLRRHQRLRTLGADGISEGDEPAVGDVRELWVVRTGGVPGSITVPLGQPAMRVGVLDRSRRGR